MLRRLRSPIASVFAAVALVAIALPTHAAVEMVVISTSGTGFKPGQVIDGAESIELQEGASLTVMGQDGTPVNLQGPFKGSPAGSGGAAAAGDRGVIAALSGLLSDEAERDLGVTRAVEVAESPALPDPWVVDVSHAGDHCVQQDEPAVLWRLDASRPGNVSLTPTGQPGPEARAVWPADFQRLFLPAGAVTIVEGSQYTVNLDGAKSDITFHIVPSSLETVGQQAAWMAQNGCETQARALVKSTH